MGVRRFLSSSFLCSLSLFAGAGSSAQAAALDRYQDPLMQQRERTRLQIGVEAKEWDQRRREHPVQWLGWTFSETERRRAAPAEDMGRLFCATALEPLRMFVAEIFGERELAERYAELVSEFDATADTAQKISILRVLADAVQEAGHPLATVLQAWIPRAEDPQILAPFPNPAREVALTVANWHLLESWEAYVQPRDTLVVYSPGGIPRGLRFFSIDALEAFLQRKGSDLYVAYGWDTLELELHRVSASQDRTRQDEPRTREMSVRTQLAIARLARVVSLKQIAIEHLGHSGRDYPFVSGEVWMDELPLLLGTIQRVAPELRYLGLRGIPLGRHLFENLGQFDQLRLLDLSSSGALNTDGLATWMGRLPMLEAFAARSEVSSYGVLVDLLRAAPRLKLLDLEDVEVHQPMAVSGDPRPRPLPERFPQVEFRNLEVLD